MCKFVHCTTMWKIKTRPRGKAGNTWKLFHTLNMLVMEDFLQPTIFRWEGHTNGKN